jgi:fatty-acyl-CoA synthase
MMLLAYMKENGKKLTSMQKTVIGVAAAPKAMIEVFEKGFNVNVIHAWGMTEMSPLGTACNLKKKNVNLSLDEKIELSLKQGRAMYGVDMKIVEGCGEELPWDGKAFGNLLVRGPWIASEYFKGGGDAAVDDDNWFDTGDVVTIDADGYLQITDVPRMSSNRAANGSLRSPWKMRPSVARVLRKRP